MRGAPSYILFGAYFPAWMFLALLAIIAAIVARAVFVATGLARILPFQLFVCAAIGVSVALLAWTASTCRARSPMSSGRSTG